MLRPMKRLCPRRHVTSLQPFASTKIRGICVPGHERSTSMTPHGRLQSTSVSSLRFAGLVALVAFGRRRSTRIHAMTLAAIIQGAGDN